MTLRDLLEDTVKKLPLRTAVTYRRNKVWERVSYAELYRQITLLAEAFGRLGVAPGRDQVALMLDNSPEWVVSYFALTGCGVAVVPIDPRLSATEVAYILRDSEAVLILAHERHLPMLREIGGDLPALRSAVLVDGACDRAAASGTPAVHSYATLREQVDFEGRTSWFAGHRAAGGDVASIIYTSGTMGKPKGAMLTHNNFCSDVAGSLDAIDHALNSKDEFLVVLPLFHSFSFTANLLLAIACGGGMGFVDNLRNLAGEMLELRPTIVMAVPLLCEKLYRKIDSRLQQSAAARLLLRFGLGRLAGRRVRKSLGGRLRYIITGGAPCPADIIRGFQRLGIALVEGYGLTECSPVVSFPKLTDARIGTIGRKLPNAEVRIADPDERGAGELQVRGPMVMKGYYKNLEATREAFDGDWLRTGDVAVIDADGMITICGRKKALIVNREGKNIYPEEVEGAIALDPLLSDAVVVGFRVGDDPGERVGVIIAPDEELLKAEPDLDAADESAVEKLVRERLARQCERLAAYKHPRKVVISREPLERTSVQKVRRCAYQGRLDE